MEEAVIAVGSKNPVKIAAALKAFQSMFPDQVFKIIGYDTDSGVSAQPMSDDETLQGAKNRAASALKADDSAVYGVGMEGGFQELTEGWFDAHWVVILERSGKQGIGQSIRIPIPDSFMPDIHAGKELGQVIDEYFGEVNAKQGKGYVGLVTNNVIDREKMVRDAVVAALIAIANPTVFSNI